MCVYFYLDIHNKYAQYTHIVCKQTFILNLLIAIIVCSPSFSLTNYKSID